MLFSIASANVRYRGIQPRRRSFALLTRLIVDYVVNLMPRRWSIQQKKKRGRDIISMDLVKKAIVFWIKNRCARQKIGQQRRASWPVDTGKPRYDAVMGQHELFGLQQYPSRLVRRFGLALLSDPQTVTLRVNAGAACKKHCRTDESIEKIACAVQVNLAIGIRVSAARASAMDYRIEHAGACSDLRLVCDINRVNRIRLSR